MTTREQVAAAARRAYLDFPKSRVMDRDTPWLAVVDVVEKALRAQIAAEIRAVAADPDRRRPLRLDAETPSDFANDTEWAAMIAEGKP
jgi:hypothetical protein